MKNEKRLDNPLIIDLKKDERKGLPYSELKVLVIYSGGTIGSVPRDRSDPESPEIVYQWEILQSAIKGLQEIPFPVD